MLDRSSPEGQITAAAMRLAEQHDWDDISLPPSLGRPIYPSMSCASTSRENPRYYALSYVPWTMRSWSAHPRKRALTTARVTDCSTC